MEVLGEFRDLQACTSMAVNKSGELALLAGRRALAVVNLDQPGQLAHKESRQSKWEISSSQWSAKDDTLVSVAANNKARGFLLTIWVNVKSRLNL